MDIGRYVYVQVHVETQGWLRKSPFTHLISWGRIYCWTPQLIVVAVWAGQLMPTIPCPYLPGTNIMPYPPNFTSRLGTEANPYTCMKSDLSTGDFFCLIKALGVSKTMSWSGLCLCCLRQRLLLTAYKQGKDKNSRPWICINLTLNSRKILKLIFSWLCINPVINGAIKNFIINMAYRTMF